MKTRVLLLSLLGLVIILNYNNCAKKGFEVESPLMIEASNPTHQPLPIRGDEANVMKVTVGCSYVNQPCVSVTICEPGTSNCQTIDKILLDTGSYGLRVFSSLINLNLNQKTINGSSLAECVSYADGSSNWGPIKSADVVLGSLKAPNIPIQTIDANYATLPTDCTKADANPTAAGYNGILGVGLFTEDCGVGCATVQNNRIYFACNASTCNSTTVPLAEQIPNPVSSLSTNNNGLVLQLPSIPSAGSTSASGFVILGIGTEANNSPAKPNFFQVDGNGNFQTNFNGTSYPSSFIDSGSNGLFFPGPASLPLCADNSGAKGFFCPNTPTTFSATQAGKSGTPKVLVSFEIQNSANAIISSPNFMFNNIGGNFADAFDWGLPFYFGKTVFHGIDGKSSVLGVGPYWAW
ncbi:MAG: DUF3443 domain-containing protein [Pseudobdellovibrionaceae bacterium]